MEYLASAFFLQYKTLHKLISYDYDYETTNLVYLKVFPINDRQGEEYRRGGGVIALKYPLLLSRK